MGHMPIAVPAVATPTRHIQGLDGLRAVAATAVVAYHVQFLVESGQDPLSSAGAAGWVGVDLFFAISGFILFLPFARAARDGRTVDVRRFLGRRARRILPAYWFNLFVLVTLAAPAMLTTGRGLVTVLADATFTADYLGMASVNSVYWSLYCEVAFYLALPLMARAFVGRRWVVGLPAAMAVGWAYRYLMVTSVEAESYFRLIMQFPGVIDQFAFGMTAGAVWALVEDGRKRVPRWLTAALVVAGTLIAAGTVWTIQRRIGLAHYWSGDTRWGDAMLVTLRPCLSLGFALVIFGVCFQPNGLRRVLELRPVRYVGLVSYGLYLWHLPVIRALADVVDVPGRSSLIYLSATAGVFMLSLAWAAASYHLIEVRYLRLRVDAQPPVRPAQALRAS